MKSSINISLEPNSIPIAADDIAELHAARLLLLINICGVKGEKIEGLTKLAKLDFFVRYPIFFNRIAVQLGKKELSKIEYIESSMVRHHYGPWDKRYYHILAYLESRRLIKVEKKKKTYNFQITNIGKLKAEILIEQKNFKNLVLQMKEIKKLLGRKSGSQLKNLIYETFDLEVKQLKHGDIIG